MADSISRRKLANYAADRLVAGDKTAVVVKELAAYLIDMGRQREYELIVRDIETALLARGTAVGDVVSARKLSGAAKTALEQYVKSEYRHVDSVMLRETVDEQALGGVKLVLPDKQLDATARTKLEKLMEV